jgi:hypothetical protein
MKAPIEMDFDYLGHTSNNNKIIFWRAKGDAKFLTNTLFW